MGQAASLLDEHVDASGLDRLGDGLPAGGQEVLLLGVERQPRVRGRRRGRALAAPLRGPSRGARQLAQLAAHLCARALLQPSGGGRCRPPSAASSRPRTAGRRSAASIPARPLLARTLARSSGDVGVWKRPGPTGRARDRAQPSRDCRGASPSSASAARAHARAPPSCRRSV